MRGAGAQLSAAEVSPAKQDKQVNPPRKQCQPHPSDVQVPPGKCHHLPGAVKVLHLQESLPVSLRGTYFVLSFIPALEGLQK